MLFCYAGDDANNKILACRPSQPRPKPTDQPAIPARRLLNTPRAPHPHAMLKRGGLTLPSGPTVDWLRFWVGKRSVVPWAGSRLSNPSARGQPPSTPRNPTACCRSSHCAGTSVCHSQRRCRGSQGSSRGQPVLSMPGRLSRRLGTAHCHPGWLDTDRFRRLVYCNMKTAAANGAPIQRPSRISRQSDAYRFSAVKNGTPESEEFASVLETLVVVRILSHRHF